jgi:hypothetical protein
MLVHGEIEGVDLAERNDQLDLSTRRDQGLVEIHSQERPPMTTTAIRLSGWSLLLAGIGAGIVLPHPVTTSLWIAAGKLFAKVGDHAMVARLTSATKFGRKVQRGLDRRPARRIGGVAEAF